MEIGRIVKGTLNEVLGLNKDILEGRLKICYSCPLYLEKYGGICNNKLWLDVKTGDVSTTAKPGYRKGCGCRVQAKTTISGAVCPVGKW